MRCCEGWRHSKETIRESRCASPRIASAPFLGLLATQAFRAFSTEALTRSLPAAAAAALGSRRQLVAQKAYSLVDKLKYNEKYFEPDAEDFVSKLLKLKPKDRLGMKGGSCLARKHTFLQDIDWEALLQRQLTPPHVPVLHAFTDVTNFGDVGKEPDLTADTENHRHLCKDSKTVSKLFNHWVVRVQAVHHHCEHAVGLSPRVPPAPTLAIHICAFRGGGLSGVAAKGHRH